MDRLSPSVKDKVSPDFWDKLSRINPMAKREARKDYDRKLRARLKQLREAKNLSQAQLAKEIGIGKATYAKYETRSNLPIYLVPRLCQVLQVPCMFLVTGIFSVPESETMIVPSQGQRRITPAA